MSPLRLYVCPEGTCPTLLFKTADGLCPRCFTPGELVAVKPVTKRKDL